MSDNESSAGREIDEIIAAAGGWKGETLARLRRAVLSADPDIVEEIKWRKPSKPEGVATWVCDGNVCLADVLKKAVRLTFPKGAQLDDPDRLFNARLDGTTVRAIDLVEGATVDEDKLRLLVRDAIAENRRS
ncbi:DUF1801 domain-containing protein [Microbacterium bovistercoris]|uniref:DUF1801 domain-containing protein n=1 Tax=Microbacterium bovistercoris TaxID=2293570 RepID=A0A371NX05_9MICO|nr:DUF1801 domain-containing protein [Microbacterium bovistercoris]REJ07685.1 DUF1801 domain-containing protein [Microbacterium bovistercoris]